MAFALQALFKVVHNVLGDELEVLLRADNRLQLRPFGLEPLLALYLLALGHLFKLGTRT